LEAALEEMTALQAELKSEEEKAAVRVSVSEAEARLMKHGDGAIAPSYNAQISAEGENKIIVGAHWSRCSSDANSPLPAVEEIVKNVGKRPKQMVVDGGFTNRNNIVGCAERGIDLVGSLPDPKEKSAAAMKALGIGKEFAPSEFRIPDNGAGLACPAGRSLKPLRKNRKRGDLYQQYGASGEDCEGCQYQRECCPSQPERGRTVSLRLEEKAEVAEYRKKTEAEEYKKIYGKRGEVAEFPNAWLKEKIGLRKFRVKGMAKAGCELLWACLAYNVMQWSRLVWRQAAAA
jgi:hypothetical protein